jgi:hypothetical protein
MREYRWQLRLTQLTLIAGMALMFDPLNIRYATDSTNMQLEHPEFRAVLLCRWIHGYLGPQNFAILSAFNPLVRERRSGASMFYFSNGNKGLQAASRWMRLKTSWANMRDKHPPRGGRIMVDGLRALKPAVWVMEGEVTEHAPSRRRRNSCHAPITPAEPPSKPWRISTAQ